jgi:hypothetical protein
MLNAFKEKRKEYIEKKRLLLDGIYAVLRLSLFVIFAVCGSQTMVGYPPQYSVLASIELTFLGLVFVGGLKLAAALMLFKPNFIFVGATIMATITTASVLLHAIVGNSVLFGLLVLCAAFALAYMASTLKTSNQVLAH